MNDQPNSQERSTDSASAPLEVERTKVRKIVQDFTQTLIQWMPLGGSGWTFVSSLLQKEWLQALLMFPVMIVTVIWAAYTEGILTRFREVFQEQGRKDVDLFMAWLKKTDRAIRWQLAATDDKYLKCQGNACLHDITEGLHTTFKPLLKDVFVPLELSADFFQGHKSGVLPMPPDLKWENTISKLVAQKEGLSIWDIFKRAKKNPGYRCLVILAKGGYGKTTLLRHIIYTYTQKDKRYYESPKLQPVLLLLRKWQEIIANTKSLDLPTLIEQKHIPDLPGGKDLKLPPNWAENKLRQGRMLVMLDGFDEVREEWRRPVSNWIGKQTNNYPDSFFILTSRPAGYRSYTSVYKPKVELYIREFESYQIKRFIQSWYLSQERHISAKPDNPAVKQEAEQKAAKLLQQLRNRSELEKLAKNPLLLNIIVNLHSFYPEEELPQRRIELYEEIMRLQLGHRPLSKRINMLLPANPSDNRRIKELI